MILNTTNRLCFSHYKKIEFVMHIHLFKITPPKVVCNNKKRKQYLFIMKFLIVCREKCEKTANRVCGNCFWQN